MAAAATTSSRLKTARRTRPLLRPRAKEGTTYSPYAQLQGLPISVMPTRSIARRRFHADTAQGLPARVGWVADGVGAMAVIALAGVMVWNVRLTVAHCRTPDRPQCQ